MRVGIDLDGVLCDFTTDFNKILESQTGRQFPVGYVPHCWDYAQEMGFTERDVQRAWRAVNRDMNFWLNLRPLIGVFELKAMTDEWDVYFITNRRGEWVKNQSFHWLREHQMHMPTVIVTKHKGSVCAALEIDCIIDDKVTNILEIQNISPSTRAYLLNQPWNQSRAGVNRVVGSVKEFIEKEGLN